jgi:hypothetical protein
MLLFTELKNLTVKSDIDNVSLSEMASVSSMLYRLAGLKSSADFLSTQASDLLSDKPMDRSTIIETFKESLDRFSTRYNRATSNCLRLEEEIERTMALNFGILTKWNIDVDYLSDFTPTDKVLDTIHHQAVLLDRLTEIRSLILMCELRSK